MNNKTYVTKHSDISKEWYVVDAEGQTLGRLASHIAYVLRGKHKAEYTPHMDMGDYVIVINAEKIHVTGNKELQKTYYRHTEYFGGLKTSNVSEVRASHPERLIENAVRGMLPHNRLGRAIYKNLKVYAGSEHPHVAQQPKALLARTAK